MWDPQHTPRERARDVLVRKPDIVPHDEPAQDHLRHIRDVEPRRT